jgi:hypothetical protein
VFTKDGFFRNVWVAVKNTVTGTIYLTTQPFFNYANQSMNDAKQHGTYLPYQIDDDGFTPYYQTNFYDYNGYLAVKLKKDAPVYDASGVQVGVLHGSTNVYDKPVLVYGDVNNFATGKTLKDVVSFRSVVVYDKDNGFVNSYTGDHYTGTQPAGNIAYVKTDALAKGLTGA